MCEIENKMLDESIGDEGIIIIIITIIVVVVVANSSFTLQYDDITV